MLLLITARRHSGSADPRLRRLCDPLFTLSIGGIGSRAGVWLLLGSGTLALGALAPGLLSGTGVLGSLFDLGGGGEGVLGVFLLILFGCTRSSIDRVPVVVGD